MRGTETGSPQAGSSRGMFESRQNPMGGTTYTINFPSGGRGSVMFGSLGDQGGGMGGPMPFGPMGPFGAPGRQGNLPLDP